MKPLKTKLIGPALFGLGIVLATPLSASLELGMALSVTHAEDRYERIAWTTLRQDPERFINYTNANGVWRTQSDATWTSGFLPGNFWYLRAMTGKPVWADYGQHWDGGAQSRATATDNDTGFQILDSFGTAIEVGHEPDFEVYKAVILQGAQTQTEERWNPTIGAYRAWPAGTSNPNSLPFELNVDMIMNMEIVLWAAENGGPEVYRDYAIAHADTTWRDIVREDGSTYHVISYNSDGSIASRRTHQGWQTNSTWSRGQAWAVYGFTMMYRYTELSRFLDYAEATFDYFVAATNADRDDGIPFSDFDAPLDSRNPSDTSAAAIVASAALELYAMTGETKYFDRFSLIMNSLSREPYNTRGTNHQALLDLASEKWGEPDVGSVFADFYYLEASWRYFQWMEAGLGTWEGFPLYNGQVAYTGDWLGLLHTRHAPWIYSFQLNRYLLINEAGRRPEGHWIYLP